MRFNHAPVKGFEVDVGAKTTIRVVNSQVTAGNNKFIYPNIINRCTKNLLFLRIEGSDEARI